MSDRFLPPMNPGDNSHLPVEAAMSYPEPMNTRPGPMDQSGESGGIQWHRVVASLKRYKWMIIAVTMTGTALGIFAARLLPGEYTTAATIWVAGTSGQGGPVRATEVLDQEGWAELVRSFNVLEAVVQQEHLYVRSQHPAAFTSFELADNYRLGAYKLVVSPDAKSYSLTTARDSVLERGAIGDSIGRTLGLRWKPDATVLQVGEMPFTVISPRDAAGLLYSRLQVVLPERGNFMRMVLTDDDAARVTTTLNGVVDQFISVAGELKAFKLRETSKMVEDQMNSVGRELRNAESRLENYKTEIITLPTEGTSVAGGVLATQATVTGEYFNEKVQTEQLTRERDALRRVLAASQTGTVNVAGLQAIPSVTQSPQLVRAIQDLTDSETNLRAMQTRYTDSARQVIEAREKVENLRTRVVPEQIGLTIASMDAKLSELNGHLASASAELRRIPTRMINEQRLTREMLSLQAIYTDLQARYQQARLAESTAIPDVKVLDQAAQPQLPSSNKAPRLIMIAFMFSLGASFALAVLLDRLDKRVLYPEQVSQTLGLSILGAIPAIKRNRAGEMSAEQAGQFIEAFRTIRVNLAHSFNSTGQITMTISSPSAGDGKSLTSSNLAVSFAVAGYRTILIDGDIRRGELHRMFSLDRKPGLLDYLQGDSTLDEIVRPTNQPGLWVIPCGTRRQHGPELLGSSAMQRLLDDLRIRYNAVLVDSPPLAAGVDPFVLGSATGNLMLVLRAGETDRLLAEAKLSLVDRMPIRVLGAVLNDVRSNDNAYRYYSYLYGYSAEEESDTAYLPASGEDRG